MAKYAVGDVQGCYTSLQALLQKIEFNHQTDTLYMAGDMVSRGADSLATLRFVMSHSESVRCVLGNHDVSLIAMHYGLLAPHKSLKPILQADDADEIIAWLSKQAFLINDDVLEVSIAHAGVSPMWDRATAIEMNRQLQQCLQSDDAATWLAEMYGNKPKRWKNSLLEIERQRYALNAFTRMRYVDLAGKFNFEHKNKPTKKLRDKGIVPWFECPKRKAYPYHIIFGHWSSLGWHQTEHVTALDTGCVWGGALTAIRIDQPRWTAYSTACS